QDADLGVRHVRPNVLPVDLSLARVIGLVTDRPRELLVLRAPVRIAGGDERLRNVALIQVTANGKLWRRAEAVEDGKDVVLLDELPRQRNSLRRVIRVVQELEVDLPPVDARMRVEPLEVRLLGLRNRSVERRRAAERECP